MVIDNQEKTQQILLSWSDLLEELLSLISAKLRLSDYLNFQLVCTAWKGAAKQLTQCLDSPLLMLPLEDNQRFFLCPLDGKFYKSTTQDEFYMRYKCLGSFHGWLLMIDGFLEDKISITNPFTGVRIDLPHWDRTHNIKRVALSSAPTDPSCTVIITLDHLYWCFKFCRVGDMEWTMEESESIMMDALVFRKRLYILCSEKPVSRYTTTNILTHLKLEYLGLPQLDGSFYDLHLVESGGELLLVLRKDKAELISTNSFIVFKLDPLTSSWAQMKKIGNRVLFLGNSCSKSFSATELGCSENQIYFIDPSDDDESSAWLVFNMEDGSIQSGSVSSDSILNRVYTVGDGPMWVTPRFV